MERGGFRLAVGAGVVAVVLASPLASAGVSWWNGTYYNTFDSWASDYTLAPGQGFTQSFRWSQKYTGWSTMAGYYCCYSGRVWSAGPFHQSAGATSQSSVSLNAPSSVGTHKLYAFVVAALDAPRPDYYNGWSHFTITVVGSPSAPSLSENRCPSGWSTCNNPLWQWGGVSVPFGSVAQYQVDPSWAAAFTTGATSDSPVLGTGTWSIKVRAQNNVGVWGPWSATVAVQVDTTPPNAPSIGSPGAGAWSNDNTPTVSWADPGDAGSGVARYERTLDGVPANLGNVLSNTPSLADGVHSFSLKAVDGVGLRSQPSNALTLRVDTAPPTTSLAVGQPQATDARGTWVTSRTPLTLSASDALSGVASTEHDGRPYTGPFSVQGPDGPHDVTFRSTDVAGNAEPLRHAALQLDNTPPETSVLDPARGTVTINDLVVPLPGPFDTLDPIVAGTITVRARVRDAGVGAALARLFADGRLVASATQPTNDTFRFRWDTSGLSLGTHVLRVEGADLLGNAASATRNVTVVSVAGLGPLPLPDHVPEVAPVVDVTLDPARQRVAYKLGASVDGEFVGVEGELPPEV